MMCGDSGGEDVGVEVVGGEGGWNDFVMRIWLFAGGTGGSGHFVIQMIRDVAL